MLEDKAREYVDKHSDLVTEQQAKAILEVIRAERGESGLANDTSLDDDTPARSAGLSHRLTREEMATLLSTRIEQMRAGGGADHPTDQYRVFTYVTGQVQNGDRPLRLMIQASAGTGKSFLCMRPCRKGMTSCFFA